MTIEIKLPELGENIESADVTAVLVKAGDKIEDEQPLLEIETDKASVEVPSDTAGTVQKVLVKEGDKVKTGEVIVIVESAAGEEQDSSVVRSEDPVEYNASPEKEKRNTDATGAESPPKSDRAKWKFSFRNWVRILNRQI